MKKWIAFFILFLAYPAKSAMQSLNTVFEFPPQLTQVNNAPTYGNVTIDAANEKYGFVFRIPASGKAVDRIVFRVGNVGAAVVLDMNLVPVDLTTGAPDTTGSLMCANSSATITFGGPEDNTLQSWALNSPCVMDPTVSNGYAGVYFNFVSGASAVLNVLGDTGNDFPLTLSSNTSSGWVKGVTTHAGALQYTDGTLEYIYGMQPIGTITTYTFNNTSTPNEYGFFWSLPFPHRVAGMWWYVDSDADWGIRAWDDTFSTVLTSVTAESTVDATTNPGIEVQMFPQKITYSANTTHLISAQPTSGSNFTLYSFDIPASSSAVVEAMPGGSRIWMGTAKDPTSASSWVSSTTKRMAAGLIIDGIDSTPGGSFGVSQ